MRYFLIFISISFSLIGCKGLDSHRNYFRNNWVLKKDYNKQEVIVINDYVLCSNIRKMTFNRQSQYHPIDFDSTFNAFKNSFNNLKLPIVFSGTHKNQCNSVFQSNIHLRLREIDQEKLYNMGGGGNGLKMVPVIYVDNAADVGLYMSSSGGSGGDFYIVTHLKLLVNIYRDENLIYRKSVRYVSKDTKVANFEEAYQVPSAVNVRQEHLDELVRLAMKDYIKRLK